MRTDRGECGARPRRRAHRRWEDAHEALSVIATVLAEVNTQSLKLIDPRPASATFVDPVVWAKTVAPFAVPLTPGVLGPSGTASPIINLLDAFFGRDQHTSQLGRRSSPIAAATRRTGGGSSQR